MKINVYILLLLLLLSIMVPAGATVRSVTTYGASGNGSTNNYSAFTSALGACASGDTLVIPAGTYRVDLAQSLSSLVIPAGVTVEGVGTSSIITLYASDALTNFHTFVSNGGNNATLSNVVIKRMQNFAAVLFPLNAYSGFTLTNIVINGQKNTVGTSNYCHAFEFGASSGTLSGFVLTGDTIENCDFGFFTPSATTGTINGVTVTSCQFSGNYADDLEFNMPSGVCTNVNVSDSNFQNNQANAPSGGFAVGFCNVQTGSVQNCCVNTYACEALHVESNSSGILLQNNTLIATGYTYDGSILVLGGSNNITINGNFINNIYSTGTGLYAILITGGGVGTTPPYNCTVSTNIIRDDASDTWVDPASGNYTNVTFTNNFYNY